MLRPEKSFWRADLPWLDLLVLSSCLPLAWSSYINEVFKIKDNENKHYYGIKMEIDNCWRLSHKDGVSDTAGSVRADKGRL